MPGIVMHGLYGFTHFVNLHTFIFDNNWLDFIPGSYKGLALLIDWLAKCVDAASSLVRNWSLEVSIKGTLVHAYRRLALIEHRRVLRIAHRVERCCCPKVLVVTLHSRAFAIVRSSILLQSFQGRLICCRLVYARLSLVKAFTLIDLSLRYVQYRKGILH